VRDFCTGAYSNAQQQLSQTVIGQIEAITAAKRARTPAQAKIDSQLLQASQAVIGVIPAPGIPQTQSTVQFDSAGKTLVDIKANVTNAVLAKIQTGGGSVVSSFPKYRAIRAMLAADQLENLAAMPDVSFIRPAEVPELNKVVSQGDITHRANLARSKFNINGSGVTVGVLSDSVDHLATLQAAGDLPPNCPAGPPCVTVISGQSGIPGTSEGTAMMEIVNSLAPGSNLAFATGFAGQAQMASNILALQAAGAQVIVDDVTYATEPVFQDGIIAQAVNTVVGNGVVYLSSAANNGNQRNGTSGTWEGDYSATALPAPLGGSGASALNFGAGNNTDAITKVDSTKGGTIVLEWSDPFGASGNDYDLYVLDPTGTSVVLFSNNVQNGTQDPVESIFTWETLRTSASLLCYIRASRVSCI